MLIKDLLTNELYDINLNQICYFKKEENSFKVKQYYIVMSDGTKIQVTHKGWTKLRNRLKNQDVIETAFGEPVLKPPRIDGRFTF